MPARRSSRLVRKPKSYDCDPDYLIDDEEEEDRQPTTASRRGRLLSADSCDGSYAEKREKNNVAVRKSRTKLKNRHEEALIMIERMAKERLDMEQSVELLSSEISELKDLLYRVTSCQPSDPTASVVDLSNLRYFDCMK